MNATIDSLGTLAANVAMKSAAAYVRTHGLTVDVDVLLECLRHSIRERITGALDDARDAFACGMADAAESTFVADMSLAGIEAAKQATLATSRAGIALELLGP